MKTDSETRKRIKLWCLIKNTKQTVLAEKIGASKQDMAHVGNGRYRKGKLVESVAEALDCTIDWLIDGKGSAPDWYTVDRKQAQEVGGNYTVELTNDRDLPLIAYAGASDNGQRGMTLDPTEIKRLPKDLAVVAVRGGSAYPAIYDGQFAVVHLTRKVRGNNVVVVVVGDSNEVMVKRWCPQPDGEHVVLASLDGGRDSLAVHTHEVHRCWPVVGVLYE